MSEQVKPAPKAYQANVFWDRQDCATLSAQVYLASDADSYIDALHAEAEALQRQVAELTNQRDAILLQARCWAGEAKAQQAITKAVGEALGGVPNWGPIAAGVDALRAENGRKQQTIDEYVIEHHKEYQRCEKMRTELEAARGLLAQLRGMINCTVENDSDRIPVWISTKHPVIERIDAFLTATPAPEVRQDCEWCAGAGHDHFGDKCAHCNTRIDKVGEWRIDTSAGREILVYKDCSVIEAEDARYVMRLIAAEQGERQEAVAHRLISGIGEIMTDWHDGPPPDNFVDLCGQAMKDVRVELAFSIPQPGPDVRALAASLYQACGAYDMPDRILDVLSAAANGEPFAHMIDGLLPCVPPSDQDVRALAAELTDTQAHLND